MARKTTEQKFLELDEKRLRGELTPQEAIVYIDLVSKILRKSEKAGPVGKIDPDEIIKSAGDVSFGLGVDVRPVRVDNAEYERRINETLDSEQEAAKRAIAIAGTLAGAISKLVI